MGTDTSRAAAVTPPPAPSGPLSSTAQRNTSINVDPAIMVTIRPGEAGEAPLPTIASGYVAAEEIGRGGMAEINAAVQLAFGRTVAVKRLLHEITDPHAIRWFQAEAVATALLQHPNIVPVHDLTVLPDGRLQLVMKKVEGLTWRQLLHPDAASAEQARALGLDGHLEILLKVCDAVAFAHARGILHRDLKPENVMIGAFGEVLVMDWGLAVAYGDHHPHPAIPHARTATVIAGTPAYMAPEMANCACDHIGPRSDVYLLGAILYEVLTGSAPHRAASVKGSIALAKRGKVEQPRERAPE
ncbi:MAG: serine/threonine protein kinase, partial [Planctomycetes bacterium]|nr:serine/threonine protein kinase [Planctomycetota bacterium]